MITVRPPRRVREIWRLAQARWLLVRINRRQAKRLRQPNPGYDELRSPLFIGVMLLAFLALVVDIGDHWPAVFARLVGAATGA